MSAVMGRRASGPRPSTSVLAWITQAVLTMPSQTRRAGPRAPVPGSIEARVLAMLAEAGPTSVARLCDAMGLPRESVRNAVNRLRERELVEAVDTERVILSPPMPAVLRIVWAARKHPTE